VTLERPVLLYDAGCRFCRWSARLVVKADRHERLAFLPLSDPAAAPFLERLHEPERLASWRVVRRDGSMVGYGWIRGRLPDAVYGIVAQHRGRLGRLVPDGPAPRRYP
jgi:DCC1-like thiol-disulfide oxidoreductase